MADQKIRVLLADDHPILRKELVHLINAEKDMEIIAEAADGRDPIEQTRRCQPHVIIMDVSMPVIDGIAATKAICSDLPETQVIGLSMCARTEEGDEIVQYVNLLGYCGVILPEVGTED